MRRSNEPGYILTLSCPDRLGIVHAVAGYLAEQRCNILDSAQFGDPVSGRFFMRVHIARSERGLDKATLEERFSALADDFEMNWQLYDEGRRPRVLILVSREDHCLHDLLYRYGSGSLRIDIPAVVSNHRDSARLVSGHGIAFHHMPVSAETRSEQEAQILRLVDEEQVELVVLARYMQILSDSMCDRLRGRAINIHHSFLPSFKGARPYHQAYQRGVKLIGATAHYVTRELDDGPIIEQEVVRVDHTMDPDQLMEQGRDIERLVLARAVQAHIQRRVLLNGHKTVVFR